MATLTLDTSLVELLDRFRGRVADARVTYPERAIVEVTDHEGRLWWLETWEATYSPTHPDELNGKTVAGASIDRHTEVLTVGFSDGTRFTVTPIPDEEDDAIENWDLFAPEGMVLIYGPRGRWKLADASKCN